MSSKISVLAARIKEDHKDSFSKFALALELLKIDQIDKAKALFENICASEPNYVGVYYHLAKLYTELNENKKALLTYKKGIEVAISVNNAHAKGELEGALLMLELELED